MDYYSIHTDYYNEYLMGQARHLRIFYNGENLQNILNNITENVKSLNLYNVVNSIIIPEHIETLALSKNSILDMVIYNKNLKTLIVESQDISFSNFPENLHNLAIYASEIKKLSVPRNLKKLKLYCIKLNLPNLPDLKSLHIYCENNCLINFLPHSLKSLSLQSYRNSFNLSNLPINLYKLKIHGFAPDLTNVNVKYVKYCDEKPINFPLSVEKIKSGSHPRNLGGLSNLRILKCNAGDVGILEVPDKLEKLYCNGYDKIIFPDDTKIIKIKIKNVNLRLANCVNLPDYVNLCFRKGYQIWICKLNKQLLDK
jgi:hypothetical protein